MTYFRLLFRLTRTIHFKAIIGVFALAGLFNGCADYDIFNDDVIIDPVSPSFGFPILNSETEIADLLDTEDTQSLSYIQARNDSLFILYNEEIFYNPRLQMPSETFSLTIPVVAESFDVVYENYAILGSSSEMKQVLLKSGLIQIEFEKDFPEDIDVSLGIPKLTFDGEPVTVSADWTENPQSSIHELELTDGLIDLFRVEDNDTIYNVFTYDITLTSSGDAAGEMTTRVSIQAPQYKKMIGYVETTGEIETRELVFDIFENVIDSPYFYFDNAALEFEIGSSVGVPFAFSIDTLFFEGLDGDIITLVNVDELPEEDESWTNFIVGEKNYPAYATDEQGYAFSRFLLNKENSNIDELFTTIPKKMVFAGGYDIGAFNPDDQIEYIHDFFVLDTSTVHINTILELPMHNMVTDLKFFFETRIDEWPDLDEIDDYVDDYDVTVLLVIRNGIPLTLSAQLDFLDDEGGVIDQLFDDQDMASIIESPEVDLYGDPVDIKENLLIVSMSKEKYESISTATDIGLRLQAITKDAPTEQVNIKPSNTLGIQMSILINAELAPDL